MSAGYDIRSYEKNGQPRLIEVKSSVGSHVQFEWSANERERAVTEGDRYFLYFVPFAFTLPDLSAPIVIIKNPVSLIKSGVLDETPSGYIVREKSNMVKSRSLVENASWSWFSHAPASR